MKKYSDNMMVSLIIACRNERDIISECLDTILAQDYPAKLTEIFVLDGESDDGTQEVLEKYSRQYPRLRVMVNKERTQPYAFNMGIKASTGKYIFIMGAHNKYPRDYVSKCLKYALEYGADNVGGRIVSKTTESGVLARAIIGSYTSSFGIGNATFRKKVAKPTFVDTVFGGCYKRDVFERIGYYNEDLKRSQDMEFNLRLVRSGGKILLAPDIVSEYYPKSGMLDFITYNFRAGKGPIRAMRITGKPLKLMHYIPALFVTGLFAGPILSYLIPSLLWPYGATLLVYLVLSLYFSISYAVSQKDPALIIPLPLVFLLRHVSYGLGSIFGLLRLKD